MASVDSFLSLSNTISNIAIFQRKMKMPAICPHGPAPTFTVLEINISNPQNQSELLKLLDEENFVINNEDHISGFNILVYKDYHKYVNYAIYKKPGFDEAFTAMKFLKPKLTEFDFVFTCGYNIDGLDTHDEDLGTEGLYQEDANCIRNDDGSIYTYERPDVTNYSIRSVTITIGLADLGQNHDILSKIILSQK